MMDRTNRILANDKYHNGIPPLALAVVATLILLGCQSKPTKPAKPPKPPGMAWIPAGSYSLGAGKKYPDELTQRVVSTPGFYIDKTEVTNEEFSKFVKSTGYKTFAERSPQKPGDPPPGSACCIAAQSLDKVTDRWTYREGACWEHPGGAGTTIVGKMNYPVIHVTFEDAIAYAKWSGKDLPTQDEWEIAGRGGLVDQTYEWGNSLKLNGKWQSNTYQGDFPKNDLGEDGFMGLAPVGSFLANGYGLFDMTGNAWELTSDNAPIDIPSGQPCHWAKGGSFLCAPNYCARYRPVARIPITIDTSTDHIGFRCVKRLR